MDEARERKEGGMRQRDSRADGMDGKRELERRRGGGGGWEKKFLSLFSSSLPFFLLLEGGTTR